MGKQNFILKVLRYKNKLKQQDIAEKLGISETTYNRKENGNSEFTISEAKQISDILNVSINEIFFNDDVTKSITNEVDV